MIKCTEKSLEVFEKSLMLRKKLGEESEIILALCSNVGNLLVKQASWHKSCYSSFTSKKNLHVIEKRKGTTKLEEGNEWSNRKITRHCSNFKIEKCVFCQLRKDKHKLVQVQTKDKESVIKAIALVDLSLLKRIGDLNLIAYGIKYHNGCLVHARSKYIG